MVNPDPMLQAGALRAAVPYDRPLVAQLMEESADTIESLAMAIKSANRAVTTQNGFGLVFLLLGLDEREAAKIVGPILNAPTPDG